MRGLHLRFKTIRTMANAVQYRRPLIVTILPIALILLSPGARATTYYVAVNGSDSNPGTSFAPLQTLQQAGNLAGPGDTVIVGDGTYGHGNAVSGGDSSGNNYSPVVLSKSGNSSAWITFKAAHKWGAILDCQMLCDSYINLYNSSYIVIQDFVITHGYKEGIHSNDAAHHITLRGNRIEYIANRSTTTTLGQDGMYTNQNCHDFIIDGNEFHDIGRTNVNWLDHGLYLHGSNYTIINNIFYNMSRGWSIQAADGLTNVLIANNTFAFPNAQQGQIMLWNSQSSITIRNNIFYNPNGYALTRYTSSLSSCAIDHNIVYGASGMMADSSGCTLTANQIGTSEKFVNISTAPFDFHLQAGASEIDTGVNISAVTVDFDRVARPQGASTDRGAYEFAQAATAPPVISAVLASGVSSNSAVISWTTNQLSTSLVEYGPGGYTSSTPLNSTLVTQHSVLLSNLTPSTVYSFEVVSKNSAGGATTSQGHTFTTAAASGSTTATRVRAGSAVPYTDPQTNVWSPDHGYSGGNTYATSAPISNTTTPALYQNERWQTGGFSYAFTVPNGTHTVKLKFAENYFTQPGQRIFAVSINGQTVLSNFDILKTAGGPHIAVDCAFPVNVTGGSVVIQFIPGAANNPKIGAIEIQ